MSRVLTGTSSGAPSMSIDSNAGRDATDDLPRLFEEFSRVTAELAASHDTLLEQVEQLKRELAAKNLRLERKKRLEALGRVAAGVAHEFRNPLGGIRLTVDALARECHDERRRGRLDHIGRAVTHLNLIVEDLLTFTSERRLRRCIVATTELVEESVALAFSAIESDRPSIVRLGPTDHRLYCDRHAMTQVLVNLLTNARQANPDAGSSIGVAWGNSNDQAWIEIADHGPGIPAGEEERIFHPFHSLRDGGTGLGLAIVHSRIEAHDGDISVVDDSWAEFGDWAGARFRIVLPTADVEQETP